MSDAEPPGTVHAAVERLAGRALDGFDKSPGRGLRFAPMIANDDTDPELRRVFALGANAGSIVLRFGFVLAMAVVGVAVKLLIGDSAGKLVLTACLGGSRLCLTGAST